MKRKLLISNDVRFTEGQLIIDEKAINYRDIDMIHLIVPKKGRDWHKDYSSTHFLTVFTIIDTPINALLNLSKIESKKMIEEIKDHIKDHIIDYYDSEIVDVG